MSPNAGSAQNPNYTLTPSPFWPSVVRHRRVVVGIFATLDSWEVYVQESYSWVIL